MKRPKSTTLINNIKQQPAYQKSLFFKERDAIYYTLANLYDKELKDKKNAVKYYKKYLETKPPAKQQQYIAYVESRLKELKANKAIN